MGKNPWTRAQLEQFIGNEESYELEFKSSRPLREDKAEKFFDDLSTHVSAFLNSDGGLLVVGVEEEKRDKDQAGKASGLSEGVPHPAWRGDRFQSKLCDRIHPAVASYVLVHTVKVADEGGIDLRAFVIEVKPGITAYQAPDKKYYSRRSFSSEAMEDKDIRLRMLADDRPRAALKFRVDAWPSSPSWQELEIQLQEFDSSRAVARKLKAEKPDSGSWTSDEVEVMAAVVFSRPTPVHELSVRVRLCLINTGSVTIRRGAVSWMLDKADSSQIASTEDWTTGIRQFNLDVDGEIPLYPEMESKLLSLSFSIPRGASLADDSSALDVVVYLDSGATVRERIQVGQEMSGPVTLVNERLAEFGRSNKLGADW